MAAVRRAARPDEQAEVDLAGRAPRGARPVTRSASAQRAASRAGDEPLGARVGGMAERVERGAGAVADRRRRRGRSASERASALRRCANAVLDERAQLRRRRRAAALEADEHRVDVRHRMEDACAATGRRTRTSQASWASTDGTP